MGGPFHDGHDGLAEGGDEEIQGKKLRRFRHCYTVAADVIYIRRHLSAIISRTRPALQLDDTLHAKYFTFLELHLKALSLHNFSAIASRPA